MYLCMYGMYLCASVSQDVPTNPGGVGKGRGGSLEVTEAAPGHESGSRDRDPGAVVERTARCVGGTPHRL